MPIPVAVFTYKRATHAKATFDALASNSLAPHTDLFIFSDGPKSSEDASAVEDVRTLIREVRGFASVTRIERPSNMGLAQSIISGVSELLERFEAIIVLEDDLVTTGNFLSYMNDALHHYRSDASAFSVTGHTFPAEYLSIPTSYPYDTYAAYRCSSWSWGTWRNRWARVDWGMGYFDNFSHDNEAQIEFNRGGRDMTDMLRLQHHGQIDSWAIRFCYAHFANQMHCIYPIKTLVKNIGLDDSGTHTSYDPRFFHRTLDAAWRPKRWSPASRLDPEIMKRFRAIWDDPGSGDARQTHRMHSVKLASAMKWIRGLRGNSK